ncbi:MAG: pyruvate:ferredoxin (flavodoxin) oxidoreductase [Clostridia bacterium]
MARKMKTMDGNTAAAHVAYAFTDVAGVYPITPSTVMAELQDKWASVGQKNIFGNEVKVVEMQSEAGAAGTVHGSLAAGALTTTFTASQGLLLMIPNMYKIAGELLPGVLHVSARALATHALSIFGDHSDVMACRQTGFAMLASTNPQESMDLSPVAHLAAIKGKVPFLHFFDGFRTSHEMQKIEVWDYADLADMADFDLINAFRRNALNPEAPVLRGTAQNPDIFFQAKEASNSYYKALPAVVEEYMGKINEKLGTDYALFNYYGAPDAERVIVSMGSSVDCIEEVIDYMAEKGEKVGLIKVRLFRPFVIEKFVELIPETCKVISVLDRTKEPGAIGEPMYLDVVTALARSGKTDIKVVGGRYGLGSKDFNPACVFAVYENAALDCPKNDFTVGIEDDVTNLSLPLDHSCPNTTPASIKSCKFWGLGSDGTVGANKNSIKIIGDNTDMYAQAYFAYDSKKSGGITVSHLRFGDDPIRSTYFITKADFVACHNPAYVEKYKMVQDVNPGGAFLLNCAWDIAELSERLPADMKRYIAQNNVQLYTVDAIHLAREIGLGGRTNMILQAAFFNISQIIDKDVAVAAMKKAVVDSYGKKGPEIVEMNHKAIDAGIDAVIKVEVPADWATCEDGAAPALVTGDRKDLVDFVNNIMTPVNAQLGDTLPVSTFMTMADGTFPQGSAAFEKRGVAVDVPEWIPENCIQCNQCSIVCPHACIRPFAVSADELAAAPEGFKSKPMMGKGNEGNVFTMSVSVLDCMGCGVCVKTCPSKNKALVMKDLDSQRAQQASFDFTFNEVAVKETGFAQDTVKGSQFNQPLLEYSGACAGCGETPYAKLITQLFGDRMYIANATGCSSIWGGSAPATPYTVNKEGKGPAWQNSLFEDNAEFGFGMHVAVDNMRKSLKRHAEQLAAADASVADACTAWIDSMYDADASKVASKALVAALEGNDNVDAKHIVTNADFLVKKSIWIFGGDGWAYDIGFGGVDHVLASGEDVNIFVFDTEVYSNTGGQMSKSSQTGQIAALAAAGKETNKKDMGAIAMSYGNVYVAQIALGANMNQAVKAISEAEAYKGPSLVLAYAPCINHGLKGGLINMIEVQKDAVNAGYWHLYRYNPDNFAAGKSAFTFDSKEPTGDYMTYIKSQNRFSALIRQFPDKSDRLFDVAVKNAKNRYTHLSKLAKLYSKED